MWLETGSSQVILGSHSKIASAILCRESAEKVWFLVKVHRALAQMPLYGSRQRSAEKLNIKRIWQGQLDLFTGLLAAILIHSMGTPGWKLRAVREVSGAPHYFITPMTFRRLFLEGGKLFRKGI